MIKRLTTIVSTVALVAGAAGVATAQTSAQIHGDPGCAPSPFDGDTVTLTGVVYVEAGTYNSGSVYFQDNTDGGMTFFDSAFQGVLAEGDEIEVTGTVGAFNEEIQLNGVTVNVLSSGNAITPVTLTTGDLADGTDQLGNFVEVEGLLSVVSSGFNSVYEVDDGSGPVTVFVDGSTGIDTAALDALAGDIVRVRGASKCFQGIGEVLPRRDPDIELLTVDNDDTSFGEVKARF